MSKKVFLSLTLAYALYGYPLQVVAPILFTFNPSIVNILIRILIVLFSLYVIWEGHKAGQLRKKLISPAGTLFIAFWGLYLVRLVVDMELFGLRYLDTTNVYVYLFAVGTCLLPSLCAFVIVTQIDLADLAKRTFYILMLSSATTLFLVLQRYDGNFLMAIAFRAAIFDESSGAATQMLLNPITISYTGEMLILGSVLANKQILGTSWATALVFKILGITVGVLTLVIGSSRGPLLSTVLLLSVLALANLKNGRLSIKRIMVRIALGLMLLAISVPVVTSYVDFSQVSLVQRMNDEVLDRNKTNTKEERDYEWEEAWEQFTESPAWGNSFVTRFDSSYPHNLFLESLMALGVIGTSILTLLLINSFKWVWSVLSSRFPLPQIAFVTFLFCASFLLTMTSGGIFNNAQFWILMALIFGIANEAKQPAP